MKENLERHWIQGGLDQRLARAKVNSCSNRPRFAGPDLQVRGKHELADEPVQATITSKARTDAYREGMNITSSLMLTAATLALSATLSACSGAPLQVNLDPLEVTVPASLPTLGKVIYPAKAAAFQSSPVSFNTVSLVGNAAATNVFANVKANLYARTSDPTTAAGCSQEAGVVICNALDQIKISTQSLTLASDGSKTGFKLEDKNGVLKAAVTAGRVWIGVEIEAGASLNSKIKLSELVASVTVF